MKQLYAFIKKEAVLSVAAILALISMFAVKPGSEYLSYIDFHTLAILFSLMAVMAGLRSLGLFDAMGTALLGKTGNLRQVILVLVGLCFFSAMVITNDVALITFVPFTFVVLNLLGCGADWAVVVAAMQTVAANLGSMLTPLGNPQNLYLYSKMDLRFGAFVALMLPYCLVSLVLLVIWIFFSCKGKNIPARISAETKAHLCDKPWMLWCYGGLFMLCLLSVMHILSIWIVFAFVLAFCLIFDRDTLGRVDYSLLLTFVAFFIFIGNLGRIPAFSRWLSGILNGHEVAVSVLASQVTSNVPAALLLSGFTVNYPALVIGTNLGGLGTLIASMASLISYRQVATNLPDKKGQYFKLFTLSNGIFLGILMAFHYCFM